MRTLAVGVALIAITLVSGLCAKLAAAASWELGVDRSIVHNGRTATLTAVAAAATDIAVPEIVGIGAMILLPVAFLLGRRRVDAVRILCVIGGALALALICKVLIDERRPSAALWAIPADSGASSPSGHATVAAAIAVSVVISVRPRRWRWVAVVIGSCYTLGVGLSRVYLANHYVLDVIGSVMTALAPGFLVAGIEAVPAVRSNLGRLDGTR